MDLMELAIRRGFIYPAFEIYGGVSGFYDYGPLGATMKKNIEDIWREVYCIGEGYLEIFSPTIAPEEVFIASGHVQNFVDPMVECKKCKQAFRADHLIEANADIGINLAGLSFEELEKIIREKNIRCPECGGELGKVESYNLMFKTHIGPGSKKVGYLRPETAQAMFILFPRLYSFYRKKLPFGVAQIGKAYRNEISPRQGVIRLREFTQAEVEIFVDPRKKTHKNFEKVKDYVLRLLPRDKDKEIEISLKKAVKEKILPHKMLAYQLYLVERFLLTLGIKKEIIRFRQHKKNEMAHYAEDCWDAEILTERFGWIEVVGIADRTNYDLKAHERLSKVEMKAFIGYKEPKKIKKLVLEPNLAKLGPEFKEKTKEIVEKIKNLSEEEILKFKESKTIEIGDFKLTEEYVTLKEIEETISGEKITPHVIEPSFGIDRILYCVLESSYREREGRRVLSLKPKVAPVKFAVFPLLEREELVKLAEGIFNELRSLNYIGIFDSSDSIGRRYARVDEIGVPFSITVDFDSLKDKTVTIRERDSMKQVRVKIDGFPEIVKGLIEEKVRFEDLEKLN